MEGGTDRAGSKGWRKETGRGGGVGWKTEREKTEERMGGRGEDEWRAGARKRGGRGEGGRKGEVGGWRENETIWPNKVWSGRQ